MNAIETKDDLYKAICNASLLGTLGLFVGSGFTKSVLETSTDYKAFNWAELLEECCDRMAVNTEILKDKGSYPEIASKICKQYCINNSEKYTEAVKRMKNTICELTTVFPEKSIQQEYEEYFELLNFNWIATTNYDTIIESILGGTALPIPPDACFTKVNKMVPIYHIHGTRKIPSSIVITNEDYAYLFRPNDYRQARLPFLMKESLVMMVGYGLGDINVITAVDWSKNVYTNTSDEYDFPIIQLLFKDEPKDNPYQDESGIIIQEVNDLHKFFFELCQFYNTYKKDYDKLIGEINFYILTFILNQDDDITNFINDTNNFRTETIDFVSSLNQEFGYIYNSYLIFLRSVIEKLNLMAIPYGAFSAYNKKLIVILDILEKVPISKMPTSFLSYIAEELNNVSYFVGNNAGQSYSASNTWDTRKNNIPYSVISELWKIVKSSNSDSYRDLRRLLKTL